MSTPSRPPIDLTRLRASVPPRWTRVTVVDEVGSTNEALLGDASAPDGAVLVAESQVAGRGRLERPWTSPPRAGVTFSAMLRPSPAPTTWSWLPLLAGVALRDAVADLTGVQADLKWPNDLLYRESKLAGILAQTRGRTVVLGIGINVSTTPAELPVPSATSLELCAGAPVDRTALLSCILGRLDHWLERWSAASGDAAQAGLYDAYRQACSTVGREVAVETTAGGTLRGTAIDISGDGRLVVRTNGTVQAIGAGDVHHVRPAT